MSPRERRKLRRAAERKAKKAEIKRAKAAAPPTGFVSQTRPDEAALFGEPKTQRDGFVSQNAPGAERSRAAINRANAQRSTGPRTLEGKLASSRNSLKHGLASGTLLIAGEDPAAFEALLHELLEEHQPANATEELLIKDMAQSWWLAQRAIRLQNDCFAENGLDNERTGRLVPVVRVDDARLSLFLRYQTTHDRAF